MFHYFELKRKYPLDTSYPFSRTDILVRGRTGRGGNHNEEQRMEPGLSRISTLRPGLSLTEELIRSS